MTPRQHRLARLFITALTGLAAAASGLGAPSAAAESTPTPSVQIFVPVTDAPIVITISRGTPGPVPVTPTTAPSGPVPTTPPASPTTGATTIAVGPPTSTAPSTTASTSAPWQEPSPSNTAPTASSSGQPTIDLGSPSPSSPRDLRSAPVTASPAPLENTTPHSTSTAEPQTTPTQSPSTTPSQGPESSSGPTTAASSPTPTDLDATHTGTPAAEAGQGQRVEGPSSPRAPPAGSTQSLASAGTRASGLAYELGVFGQDTERTQRFQDVVDRKVDVLTVFPTRDDGWTSILGQPWWLSTAPPGFTGTLDVGVPLFPADGDLATAASGGYNEQWTELGALIASKYPTAYVRPGWEMNIVNWPWKATSENAGQWKQAFQHAYRSLKAGGPNLRVQWVVNSGVGNSLANAEEVYPGDDHVDVIGIDAYAWSNEDSIHGKGGVADWIPFARSHGKLLSLPEWGVHRGDDGAGDDAGFVTRMTDLLSANASAIAFASYFDETDAYIANSVADGQAPAAGAALKTGLAKTAGAAPNKAPPDSSTPTESASPAPNSGTLTPAVSCPAATVTVGTAEELARALADAKPGAVIALHDGTYQGAFDITTSGTPTQPITLCGSAQAIIDAGSQGTVGLRLEDAHSWRILGLTVRNARTGIQLDRSTGNLIQAVTVTQTGEAGIDLRTASDLNTIAGAKVSSTGQKAPQLGEGIRIGSDGNQLLDNAITATAADPIRIAQGNRNTINGQPAAPSPSK